MTRNNPFNHKIVEKSLFAAYMPTAEDKRRMRGILRKMARHIEHAYEIGVRDGRAGKLFVPQGAVPSADDSPLKRGIYRRAYAAYRSGYEAAREGA